MWKKFILLAAVSVAHAQQPDLSDARVTIPYSELKELWKTAQQNNPSPAKPPIPAALVSARYETELHGDQLSGFVEFEAQSFSDEWTMLPLVGADLRVEKIEPPSASVVLHDGAYTLVTNHAERQQIKLHFSSDHAQGGSDGRLLLANAPALVSLLTIRGIPADKSLQVNGTTPISNEKGVAVFRLGAKQAIELRFASVSTAAPVPSQWQIGAQALVRQSEDLLRYETHISAIANNGSAQALRLKLPAAARVVSVGSDDLLAWRAEQNGDDRVIALQWRTPNLLQRQIEIVYELPQKLEGEWKLRAPENLDGTTDAPIFAVTAEAALGLTSADKSEPVPQAPRWLASRIASLTNVLVTRHDVISAKLLPVVEIAPATVSDATFSTRIVADGSLISEQSYDIRASNALAWTVQLPKESELLSCAINDRRVNPIDRGEGTLEISIAPPPDGKPTRVALAYTSRTTAFQPVSGRVKIELPKTPLLINALEWDIAIPAEYEVAAFEGNVAPAPGAKAREGSTVVHLKKELCRNEQPYVELFYQRPEVTK